MSFKLKLIAIIILTLFAFPQSVKASDREIIALFETHDGINLLVYEDLYFVGEFSQRERAWVVFYNLLCMDKSAFVPSGVQLLGVFLVQQELVINVSSHIKNYGGIYNEKHLRAQIVLTGLELSGIEAVTLLIDGEPAMLPEGLEINRVNEWDELMD